MRGFIKRRLNAGFAVAIILVLMVGALSFATFQKQSREAQMVNNSYQIINQLVEIQQTLIDMETGRRGFRSTNEKKFLAPYNAGLARYPSTLTELETLLKDNPSQINKAERVKTDVEQLLEFWESLGTNASRYTREDVIKIMTEEKLRVDNIRVQLGDMIREENLLLAVREKESSESKKLAKWELAIGILLILAIVILLIIQIVKEFRHRRKAEAKLQSNLEELTLVNSENAERNWLLSGLAKVNDSLQGHVDEVQLSESILNTIIKYLDLRAGAFYIYNEDNKRLILRASYALKGVIKQEYDLQEGFVGQAAASREPLVLADISPDYVKIESATVSIEPMHVMYVPLIHDNKLKGVIEVLFFNSIEDKAIRFLKVVTNNIAVELHSLQAHEKVLQLLEQVQQQKQSLENQQEELRQTNEELSVQAEVLQASEEELRVQDEELKQINNELNEKNEAINKARQSLLTKASELELASKYKSEFLANMSHELRTPLNSVLILAKLLSENREKNLTEKQVSHAKIINKSGTDLLELINDILDLSKIEAGKIEVIIEDVAIKNIATDMQQLFLMVANEKLIDYTVEIQPAVPPVIKTDKQKVEQILKNLLSNAFKFTPGKGKVSLTFAAVVEEGAHYVSISVADTGIGIPLPKQKVIFEAFQQADGSTSRKFGGTGLGLSITKELVRMLKGKLKLESEPEKGSNFIIYIPIATNNIGQAKPEVVANTPVSFPVTVKEQTSVLDDRNSLLENDKVLLIIEDDAIFASVINDFARANGYKTIVALSGDEGWWYAKKLKPSAIILDLHLPVYDGKTLLKVFKEDKELKQIPVHVISASGLKNLPAGALAFLNKPVKKEELEEAFKIITDYLKATIKRVMIISGENLKSDIENRLVRKQDVVFDVSDTVANALEKLKQIKYDCIIVDIGNNIDDGISKLNTLNAGLLPTRIPTIISLDNDITAANELELKRIADVVVRKSSFANKRIFDELELFLYKVEEVKGIPAYGVDNVMKVNETTLENKKALLVDDDMRNIFALSAALEQERIEVITASNGQEALDALEKNKNIDIVLMDVMMPEMDGYDAIRYIRKNMKLSRLPIIAVTAKAMKGDRDKCIEAGASDYISKPVEMQKLISLMRVWLS